MRCFIMMQLQSQESKDSGVILPRNCCDAAGKSMFHKHQVQKQEPVC